MSDWHDAWAADDALITASVATPTSLTVTLPCAIPLLHTLRRMSWEERDRHTRTLSEKLTALLPHDPHRKPFARATVLVQRFSTGLAGDDELFGGGDALVDVLFPASSLNPYGLGLIRNRYEMVLTVEAAFVPHRHQQRTVVAIEKVPWGIAL